MHLLVLEYFKISINTHWEDNGPLNIWSLFTVYSTVLSFLKSITSDVQRVTEIDSTIFNLLNSWIN